MDLNMAIVCGTIAADPEVNRRVKAVLTFLAGEPAGE